MTRGTRRASQMRLLALLAAAPLAACGGEASQYAGTWSRELYGEGEVKMNLAANGDMELMLPEPRWPAEVDMKGRASIAGDTLIFRADTATSSCQTADARYMISRTDDELHIAGVGMDNCGGRRAALVGTWKKT
jgi:hypothetical protein